MDVRSGFVLSKVVGTLVGAPINEQTETQLRIAVSRIVCPMRASHPRKLQMGRGVARASDGRFLGRSRTPGGSDHGPGPSGGPIGRAGGTRAQELQRSLPWYEQRYLMSCLDPTKSAAWHARQVIPGLVVVHLVLLLFMGWLFWRLSPA